MDAGGLGRTQRPALGYPAKGAVTQDRGNWRRRGQTASLGPGPGTPEDPKNFYVLHSDIEHFDPTPGCPGCDSVIATGRVQSGQGHTNACRQRIMGLLAQDESGRRRLVIHRRKSRPGASQPEGGQEAMQDVAPDAAAEAPAAEAG